MDDAPFYSENTVQTEKVIKLNQEKEKIGLLSNKALTRVT